MRWVLCLVGEFPDTEMRAEHLRRVVGLSGLALVAATWKLWTPQGVFPQVPFFQFLRGTPDVLHWITHAVMLVTPRALHRL